MCLQKVAEVDLEEAVQCSCCVDCGGCGASGTCICPEEGKLVAEKRCEVTSSQSVCLDRESLGTDCITWLWLWKTMSTMRVRCSGGFARTSAESPTRASGSHTDRGESFVPSSQVGAARRRRLRVHEHTRRFLHGVGVFPSPLRTRSRRRVLTKSRGLFRRRD